MLTIVILIIIQILVLAGIGHWVLQRILSINDLPLETLLLFALGLVGIFCHSLSLFIPINIAVQIFLFICGISAWGDKTFHSHFSQYKQRLQATTLPEKLLLVALTILAITLAAGPIIRDDTESYHLQSILWVSEYGTVPGLANLHTRYGFNSSWFHTVAAIVPIGAWNYYTTPNTLLSLIMAAGLLIPLYNDSDKDNSVFRLAGLLTFATLLACWYYWRGNIQSTNYDYFFTVACIQFIVQYVQSALSSKQLKTWALLIPIMLVYIRPMYAPTLLFTAIGLYDLMQRREIKKMAGYGFTILLLVGLFAYRNYILSGYPFFPNKSFAIWNPPWLVPSEQVDALYQYIRNYSWPRDMGWSNGLIKWVQDLYGYDKFLLLLGGAGLLSGLLFKRTKFKQVPLVGWLFVLIQILAWLLLSPEPRFVSGLFISGWLLFYLRVSSFSANAWIRPQQIRTTLVVILLGLNLFVLHSKFTNEQPDYENHIYPSKIPTPETHIFTWQEIEVRLPQKWKNNWNARCYLTPLPCAYDSLPGVRLRGKKLKDGFYVERYEKRRIP